jgi:hypothetical protein
MTESSPWKIRARMREFESGEAPRECYFCLDVAYQAEFKRLWLEGADPIDIRKEWLARCKAPSRPSWEPSGDAEPEPEPPADRWASPAFDGSRPSH